MTAEWVGQFRVRVWRQEKSSYGPNTDGLRKFLLLHSFDRISMPVLARKILKQKRVNTVEVLDKSGNGIVLRKVKRIRKNQLYDLQTKFTARNAGDSECS